MLLMTDLRFLRQPNDFILKCLLAVFWCRSRHFGTNRISFLMVSFPYGLLHCFRPFPWDFAGCWTRTSDSCSLPSVRTYWSRIKESSGRVEALSDGLWAPRLQVQFSDFQLPIVERVSENYVDVVAPWNWTWYCLDWALQRACECVTLFARQV